MNTGLTSKEQCFERVGKLADEMIETYGKDFALGVLILTARFVAEGKSPGNTGQSAILATESQGGMVR
ncbi:hypothetical protein [Paraburkholderia acidiphila]|uniref:Uncharacterized protein n=1 Tax=Paraburkholderia acidiphila TaxID=2571747 RepID=A0A7Z2JCD1_9BURK|nr:hypothetical protein [Paraburkholderia acidiphila]QGZ58778.1 hypothetical protein FAZ97_27880 [Paraburkholderia acidiphila]